MMAQYFRMVKNIAEELEKNHKDCQALLDALFELQKNERRLFIIGVGGSAANASHAVSDFRKLCEIEAYNFDNLAELTARTNDEGWESVFEKWLVGNNLEGSDMVMVFSVGGGNEEKKVSVNLINALKYAKFVGATTTGIVGRDGGYTKQVADICVVIPTVNEYLITPFVESFQAIIWHMLVFHPSLNVNQGRWESIAYDKK